MTTSVKGQPVPPFAQPSGEVRAWTAAMADSASRLPRANRQLFESGVELQCDASLGYF
jgi:hypothetical protein